MRLFPRPVRVLLTLAGLVVSTLPARMAGAQAAPRPGVLGAPRPSAPPPRQPGAGAPAAAVPARQGADSGLPLTLFGTIYDSLSQRPLAGATVQVVSERNRAASFTSTTDSAGNYRILKVPPGRYIAGFFHPAIDALGVTPPPQLIAILPDTAARYDMAVPGPRRMRQVFCGPPAPGDTTGALVGVVRDADSRLPVTNARVVVTWSEFRVSETGVGTVHRRVPAKVRPEGGFVICGLPAEGAVVANAEAPGRPGGLIELQVPPRSVVLRDFLLGDSATTVAVVVPDTAAQRENRPAHPITVARGSARLTGSVRSRDGRPVNARVEVWGTGVQGSVGESGTFALGGLPAGTQSLEVRAIGFEPKRVAVDLSAKAPASVNVVLEKQVATLSSVVVRDKGSRAEQDYNGFLERKRRSFGGRFFTSDDIAQQNPLVMTDLMRRTPGMTVSPNGQFGYVMRGRGGCTPDVVVDGMRVMEGADELDNLVRPGDVDGVEVYTSATDVPPQYAGIGGSSCGAVLVWTKRGGTPKRAR